MSLYALASGTLIADPQRREGGKGPFATASLRVATGDDAILISVVAFAEAAERLLEHAKGDSFARLEQFWGFWPRKVAEMLGSTGAAPIAWC